jgi:hypothetical protein
MKQNSIMNPELYGKIHQKKIKYSTRLKQGKVFESNRLISILYYNIKRKLIKFFNFK